MKKSLTQKVIVTFSLVLVFLATYLIPTVGYLTTKVSASSNSATTDFDTLYYYSDNSSSSTYKSAIEGDNLVENVILEYSATGLKDELLTLDGDLADLYEDGELENSVYANSYFIVEFSQGFEVEEEGTPLTTTQILNSLFEKLKSIGCKIMFICDTDEMRFIRDNAFLGYVDLHVNSDIWSVFMMSFFYEVVEAVESIQLQNVTFILNDQMVTVSQYCDFYHVALVPFIKATYADEVQNYATIDAFLQDINVNVFYPCGTDARGQLYRRLNSDTNGDFTLNESLEDEVPLSDLSGQLGTTIYGVAKTPNQNDGQIEAWIGQIEALRLASGEEIPTYVFSTINKNYDAYNDVYSARPYGGGYYEYIEAFLTQDDYSELDNWSGECPVTHKTLVLDPNAWLWDVLGADPDVSYNFADYVTGWSFLLSEEEANDIFPWDVFGKNW